MKKKGKTRLGFSAVLAVAIIVLLAFVMSFLVSFPSYGDTFKGKLSDKSYLTANDAAYDFIECEINGTTTAAKFVQARTVEKLNEKDTAKLGIEYQNFDSVEKVEITYSIGENLYTYEIYVCYLENDGFRYFAPPVFTGERLTSSYYNSIIQSSDFKNCTLNLQSTSAIKIFGVPIKSTTNYTMKIDNGIAYYHSNVSFLGFGVTQDIYAFDTEYGLRYAVREIDTYIGEDITDKVEYDTGWELYNSGEVVLPFSYSSTSISDFSLFGVFNGIDHTYYEKTNTGFAVAPSKREDFTKIAVSNCKDRMFDFKNYDDEMKEYIEKIIAQANWEYDCNYVVDGGHLRQAYLKSYADMKDVDFEELIGEKPPEWVDSLLSVFSIEASAKCDIVNIGTTSFDIDTDAMKLIEKYL